VYKAFFGLKKNPFNVNPDPAYLYLTSQMRQALDELMYGIESRKGLMLLTGEAGTGKTTLINHLLLWLEHKRAKTAFIFNSHLDSDQLFDFIISDFEIPVTPQVQANPLLTFNEWLLERFRARDLVVLIVDEAQGLPVNVLEEIRLLCNMETPNEKLLQIVLVGQPELEFKLKRPDLRQLHQRISLRCKTAPLSLQECAAYIEDRLHTAGSKDAEIFLPEAVEAIHSFSRGIPRVVNLLCDNALIHAYVEQERAIPAGIIEEVAREMQFDDFRPMSPRTRKITQPLEAPDLGTLLAKIKADADQAHAWGEAHKATPFIVTQQKPSARADVSECEVLLGVSRGAEAQVQAPRMGAAAAADASSGVHRSADNRVQYWRMKRSRSHKFFHELISRAGATFASVDMRSLFERTHRSLEALQIGGRSAKTVRRIRAATVPALAAVAHVAGPRLRAKAAAFGNLAGTRTRQLHQWSSRTFREEMYGKIFLTTVATAAILYLIARKMDPAQGWQHPGLLVIAFAGLLLCVLSLALGTAILLRSRSRLRKDSSELVTSAVRWLQAPMGPAQFRDLSPAGGKVHSQRRAS
jgi:general secretion pathway protein A